MSNWNVVLSSTRNLNDVLIVLQKVLALLQNKADVTTIDEALDSLATLDQQAADSIREMTNRLNQFGNDADTATNEAIMRATVRGFATEQILKQWTPDFNGARAKADDTKKIWRWELSTASWVDTGLSELDQAINFTQNKVESLQSEIIVKSSNLFNDATSIKENKIISADGSINTSTTGTDFAYSDYIQIKSNQNYYFDGFRFIAYYDADKNFIHRVSVDAIDSPPLYYGTYLSPANAEYMRVVYKSRSVEYLDTKWKINEGDNSLPYEPFNIKLKDNIEVNKNEDWVFGEKNIEDEVISPQKTTFFKKSANLFNHKTATIGYVVSAAGVLTTSTAYSVSDFVEILPNTKYTISGELGYNAFASIAYYDTEKNFIVRRDAINRDGPLTITTHANARFVRLNMNVGRPDQRNRMINVGEVALPYEPFGEKLTGIEVGNDVIEQIGKQIIVEKKDAYIFDLPVDRVFSTDKVWTDLTNFTTITAAEVYQLYDGLLAEHPDYISKQFLGNDVTGKEISLYKFKPELPDMPATKTAKIFIICGAHGMEHTPPLATYRMLQEMCESWQSDELLEVLRFNVEFLIIPVLNPDGWDRYNRVNGNGVDLNRNFPIGWVLTEEGATYSGPSPASELETQYAMQVFTENPDIDIFYDFHNFNGNAQETNFIWLSTMVDDKYMQSMGKALITRMTRKWRKEHSFIPAPPYFAGYVSETDGAMAKTYARSVGVKFSATIELGNKWWIDQSAISYDVVHQKTMTEALVNWILINLNELQKL